MDAIDGLERAVILSLSFRGDPVAEIEKTLEEHPEFIMGWIFKAAWMTQYMETRIYGAMVASLGEAEKRIAQANNREVGHFEAITAWIKGDFYGAVQKWEALLVKYPMDLLALELAHYTKVLLGDVVGQRDVVARVSNLWDESVPGYEFVLGFYAFGLEENRDFSFAEEQARKSLSIRPDNPYAIHTVAHVMEMRGRQAGGIRFMNIGLIFGGHQILPIIYGGTRLCITLTLSNMIRPFQSLTTIWIQGAKVATNTKSLMLQHYYGG